MKLTELNPHWLRVKDERTWQHEGVEMAEADGIMFTCPKPGCTHQIICWFTGRVADGQDPRPGRWNPDGHGFSDLTFVGPGQTSVKLLGGCNAHFFIEHGEIKLT